MENQQNNIDIYLESLEYFQKLEKLLATKLELTELKSGLQVIRNENGWRENEKSIDYIWIVTIARSFVGWGGLFEIKFNENKFRERVNPEKLMQGLFTYDRDGINSFYNNSTNVEKLIDVFSFNLFEANKGIALDGVCYNIRIIANNINTFIKLNNPNADTWKKWESEIWTLGKKMAIESNNQEMIDLFK